MSEVLRSFLVVLVIAATTFGVAQVYAKQLGLNPIALRTRRNTWFLITAIAFLANNAWIYLALTSIVLLYAVRAEKNIVALVFLILYAVPLIGVEVPGFGVVNYLIQLDYFRLISIFIFIPLFIQLRGRRDTPRIGEYATDVFVLLYIGYLLVSVFPHITMTHFLRVGFGYFIDIFLPYFVVSRYIKSIDAMNDALQMLLLASVLVGLLGVFEFLKGWLLYSRVADSWGVDWGLGWYLKRGGLVRAIGSSGQPIVLGYMLAVAAGLYMYLSEGMKSTKTRHLLAVFLFACLFAPISRGPWLGAGIIYFVWLATGENALKRILKGGVVLVLAFVGVLFTPYGGKLSEFLPFVGDTEEHNIEFRNSLLENSIQVIQRNPFFGSSDFMNSEELLSMKSGGEEGIVDIVNSYIAIALSGGLVGLTLFVSIFLSAGYAVYVRFKRMPDGDARKLLGRMLFSTLIGVLFIIYTVSSISFVPVIYWILCGLCVAYRAVIVQK